MLKSRNEKIQDLEEQVLHLHHTKFSHVFHVLLVALHYLPLVDYMMLQIRDLTVYFEAQKTLNNISDSDDIKGGTLLPVPEKESSPPSNSRKKKGGRRRN